jgi:hypothetical protein
VPQSEVAQLADQAAPGQQGKPIRRCDHHHRAGSLKIYVPCQLRTTNRAMPMLLAPPDSASASIFRAERATCSRTRADALRAELGVCGQRPSSTTREEGLNDSFLRLVLRSESYDSPRRRCGILILFGVLTTILGEHSLRVICPARAPCRQLQAAFPPACREASAVAARRISDLPSPNCARRAAPCRRRRHAGARFRR